MAGPTNVSALDTNGNPVLRNARPTGTTGCHEYFSIFKGTNADATYSTFGTDVGSIPATGPFLPQPSSTTGGGRRLLYTGSGGGNTSPSLSSDARLKEGIAPTGAMLAGLLVYSWRWNGAAKALDLDWQPTSGVMAQEALLLYPEVVSTDAHGYFKVDYAALRRLDAAAGAAVF